MDWDSIREHKYAPERGPSDWSPSIKPISLDGTALFGIDPNGELYWDGKKIKTIGKVSLEGWTLFIAATASLGAFLSGITDLFEWIGWKPF
jgi:hypothetical protein